MGELPVYEFAHRASSGVLLGLSAARLATVAAAGVVFIAVMVRPAPGRLAAGAVTVVVLLAAVAVKVAGRSVVDWAPVWAAHAWRTVTRRNEFYTSPELANDLPDEVLDLPGGLFGVEIHTHTPTTDTGSSGASVANPTPTGYGLVRDTFRHRLVAVAEVSAGDFLFPDPDDQQARIAAWGATLDHLAHSLPELSRLQLLHTVGAASVRPLAAHHDGHGGRGTLATAESYRDVIDACATASQQHRVLLAVGLDLRGARRTVRQAGGGIDGAARVLMDRAAVVEDALTGAGLHVNGWLPARAIAQVLKVAFDPAAAARLDGRDPDVTAGGGIDPAAAGPTGMIDTWLSLRHDSGWSTTLEVVRPPTRPVTGDFLKHLLIGVAATRRLSLLYVPTSVAAAERRAQTQQTSTESETHLRARWGFATSARQRAAHLDAARREQDLVDGRAVFKAVWLVTVTAATPAELDVAVGHVDAAARRCSLELRRLAGTQRAAFAATLPLCRGAR